MNFYNFNNFPVVQFWSFFEDPHILTIGTLSWRRISDWVPIATETRILQMYGSDAGQPPRSLYTKAPLWYNGSAHYFTVQIEPPKWPLHVLMGFMFFQASVFLKG